MLQSIPLKIVNIRARFMQPLYLDEPAHVRIRDRTDNALDVMLPIVNEVQ